MAATASHMAASGADTEATAVSRGWPYREMNLQEKEDAPLPKVRGAPRASRWARKVILTAFGTSSKKSGYAC
jgi:hypothetical protein